MDTKLEFATHSCGDRWIFGYIRFNDGGFVNGALTSNTNMTSTSITLLGPNPKAASGVLTFDGTNFLVNGMRELAVSRQISELPTTASLADVIVAFNKLIKIVSSNKEGK